VGRKVGVAEDPEDPDKPDKPDKPDVFAWTLDFVAVLGGSAGSLHSGNLRLNSSRTALATAYAGEV
jgi:hypothetical protein